MCEQNLQKWIEAAEKSNYRPNRLAKKWGISRKQLERWTKLRFGLTPQEWMDHQRLNKAVALLKRNEPIKDVGQRLGFKQLSHFSRKFKLYHGLSPKSFVIWMRTEQTEFAAPAAYPPEP
jgi:AraC-like DNA-binding protein